MFGSYVFSELPEWAVLLFWILVIALASARIYWAYRKMRQQKGKCDSLQKESIRKDELKKRE